MAIAIARLVNNSTVSAVRPGPSPPMTAIPSNAWPPKSTATTTVPANERSMSARSACPSSNASHNATATPSSSTSKPVDASASQLGTKPSGMISTALPNAKNNVATTTTPTTETGCERLRTAATNAPRVDAEITANITQCPARSGPSTLPAIPAPTSVAAATTATRLSSVARPRQVSGGRASSSTTANQATPGTATR